MTNHLVKQDARTLAEVVPLLACPSCRAKLSTRGSDFLECVGCGARYPVRAGVPILLPANMQEAGIGTVSEGDPVSRHPYSPASLDIIERHRDGWVLDLGAGGKHQRWANVIQVDIFRYPMTDVVATADCLPFRDNAFQAVISQAVFEHLQYPEWAAAEIRRVLQPGGTLKIDTAFLQPEHGYPHHFFNATETGLRHWFRDFDIEWSGVEAYQHPKWSLSWFLAVYLDRISPMDAATLGAASMGQVLRVLERSANGQHEDGDAPILRALDALPVHELRTLAAGVSLHALNPPKTGSKDIEAPSSLEYRSRIEDVRKIIAARQEVDGLREQLAVLEEARLLANDRGNYLAQFFPAFNSLQSLGIRAWMQFKIAGILRTILPSAMWFRLRGKVKQHENGGSITAEPPFITFIVEPEDPISFINAFFSLSHQTYTSWELIVVERVGQLPSVRRAIRDFSRLDQRVRVIRAHGDDSCGRLQQAHASVNSQYVLNLPMGGVVAREAVRSIYTLVRGRSNTSAIFTDFEHASHELAMSIRCYGKPIPGAVLPGKHEFSFIAYCVEFSDPQVLSAEAETLDSSVAYIPEALFRQVQVGEFP